MGKHKKGMNMKIRRALSIAGALALAAGGALAAPFVPGNLVVSRVGDGANPLVNTGGPISLLEYTTSGTLVQTISIPSGNGGLQWSGTATSEGALTLSQDKTKLTLAGYIPPFTGSGSLASRTDTQAPRGYVTVDFNGVVGTPVAIGAYGGNNIRAAVSSNTGAYFAGGNSGTIYRDTTNTTIQNTVANTRVVNIFNNKLYFSTASGSNRGVWTFDTALPTGAATASVLMNQGGTGEVYDFAIGPAGDVAYLTNSNIIERWAFDGVNWSITHTQTVATGLTGIAVDFGAMGADRIWTVNPGNLYGLTFTGTAFTTPVSLASAGTNYAFRGLEFSPIPEPGTAALVALGLGASAIIRRRRKA